MTYGAFKRVGTLLTLCSTYTLSISYLFPVTKTQLATAGTETTRRHRAGSDDRLEHAALNAIYNQLLDLEHAIKHHNPSHPLSRSIQLRIKNYRALKHTYTAWQHDRVTNRFVLQEQVYDPKKHPTRELGFAVHQFNYAINQLEAKLFQQPKPAPKDPVPTDRRPKPESPVSCDRYCDCITLLIAQISKFLLG